MTHEPLLEWLCARTADAWPAFGFDEQLGRAAEKAAEGTLARMQRGGDARR